jgi:hypothetical protein
LRRYYIFKILWKKVSQGERLLWKGKSKETGRCFGKGEVRRMVGSYGRGQVKKEGRWFWKGACKGDK